MAQIIEDNIGITKEDYLNIEKYQTRNNNREILENIFEEVRQIQASSEIPNILFKRVTFSTMTSLYNFLNEELKEKVIPFSFNNSEKTEAKELFRNSLFIIRKFRNEIAHTMDFVNYKSDRYVVFRYLKKSLNNIGYVKLTNKKDFVGNRRGSNDIFAMILVIILLLDYDFLREEMLKELAIFIGNEDQEKFKDYAKITNLPKNLLERIIKVLNERMY